MNKIKWQFILFAIINCLIFVTGVPALEKSYFYEVYLESPQAPIAVIDNNSGPELIPNTNTKKIETPHHNEKTIEGKEYVDTTKLCLEPGCVHAASKLLSKMNLDAKPCDDFFEFACGRFVKDAFISDDKTSINTFVTMRDKLKQQLRIILEEPIAENEIKPFVQTKTFYKTCMNKKIIAEREERPLLNLLKLFGGYPALEPSEFKEESFSWVDVIKKFRQMGISVDYLFDFSVALDSLNSSKRLIEIDQPSFRIAREFLVKGRNNTNVQAYFEYMRDLTILLGAKPEVAEQDISEMVDFEILLAEMSAAREKRRNATLLYNPISMKDLQTKYTWLNWNGYISAILPPDIFVDENEIINVVDLKFFDGLGDLLNSVPKKVLANFLMTRLASDSVSLLTDKLRKRRQSYLKTVYGQSEEEPRWKECSGDVLSKLPNALSAMYVRHHFDEDAKKTAMEMVDDIKLEFENILKSIDWMDVKTRDQALIKLKSMATLIAYPDELNQDDVLIDYYKGLEIVDDDLLESSHQITKFLSDKAYGRLRDPVIKNEWRNWAKAAQVNAFYNRAHNHIKFPAGILQDHFFSADRPKYLNYAAIGSVIGHEITHGFDDQGSQFDGEGNLKDWWDPVTKQSFKEKAKCIINQYNTTLDAQTGLYLNGITTQGENIADNGGIKEAYAAYLRYVDRNGPEKLLPGLRYTQQQLFWIASSQNWCSKYKTEALKVAIAQNAHPPNKYRVLLPLQNSKEFAKDFKCPEGSPMNPTKKCQVW